MGEDINLLVVSSFWLEGSQLLVEIKKKKKKKGCSIKEVMEELHSIDGVAFGSALHTFAIKFFYARSKREIRVAMGCIDRKISWLKNMFDQHRQT